MSGPSNSSTEPPTEEVITIDGHLEEVLKLRDLVKDNNCIPVRMRRQLVASLNLKERLIIRARARTRLVRFVCLG